MAASKKYTYSKKRMVAHILLTVFTSGGALLVIIPLELYRYNK